jgi:hypothetical protein
MIPMLTVLAVSVSVTAAFSALGESAVTTPLPEAPNSSVGYPTVEAALTALRAKPGVHIQEQQGWTIVSDKESGSPVLWSFTPAEHPAHPSAVKRRVVTETGGLARIEMNVLCQADKTSCDALVRQFQVLNDRLIEQAKNKSQESRPAAPPSTDRGTFGEINITPDSAPGWLPSADQRAQVPQVIGDFLAALDGGQYEKAYDLQTEGQRRLETFDAFAKRVTKFNAQAGPVKERRIVKITWTKDPAHAPAAGVYAAVDLVSRFALIDRHGGYIVLYHRDAPAPFQVMREEDNYMTNEQSRQIEQTKSRQAVDQLWTQLARNCPNYVSSAIGSTSE